MIQRTCRGPEHVDVVVMGYIFNEKIRFVDKTIGPVLGGTASYAAVCLGCLGTRTGIVSNIAQETPEFLIRPLSAAGVDLSGLNRRPGISTTEDVLEYDAEGNKRIQYLSRAPLIRPEDIPIPYLSAKVFHLCEVDFEVPLETVKTIKVKCPSAKIAADLGGIGGAHSTPKLRSEYVEAEGGRKFNEYLEQIDYAKASLEDCFKMFSRTFDNADVPARMLLERGIDTVIITLGERGSLILTKRKERFEIPAIHPEGGVSDITGAGDTFISAFLSEYLISNKIFNAAIFAAAASSILIEKTGGVSTERSPTRAQVLARMATYCSAKGIAIDCGL